jgi:hypothetical protein
MVKEYVKNYREKITEIEMNLKNISAIVETLPESSWKKSLNTSVVNFVKKINGFLESGGELTEQQKNAIKAIKSGKCTEAEVSALSSRVEKPVTAEQVSEEEKKPAKKSGKKN